MKKNVKIVVKVFIVTVIASLAFFIYLLNSANITYIAFGDSLAQGYPYYLQNKKLSYTDIIYNHINSSGIMKNRVVFHNFGVSGYTSSDLYNLLSEDIVAKELPKADIITINIGGNDLLQTLSWHKIEDYEYILNSVDNYTDNLAKIFSKLRTKNPNAWIYISSLYNPITPGYKNVNFKDADYMVKYTNKIIKNTASPYNVKVVDITNIFNNHEYNSSDSWFYDMLHPNQKGYSEMSRPFVNTIFNDFTTKHYIAMKIKKFFD